MAYLRYYLEEIREIYNEARGEYVKIIGRRDADEHQYKRLLENKELNAKGVERVEAALKEIAVKYDREYEELMQKTEAAFGRIRNAVDVTFRDLYRINPDKIDTNALELLKSGIMTNNEMAEFARGFGNNPTMRRMIGKYISERVEKDPANDELRMLLAKCSMVDGSPHLDAVDALIGWSRSGLRADRMLADRIAEVYDQETAEIFLKYGDICTE